MKYNITIRPAQYDDASELANMWWTMHSSFENYDPRYYQHQNRETCIRLRTDQFKNVVDLQDVEAFVAEVDGILVGYVLCGLGKRLKVFAIEKMITIGGVFVLPEYRRMDIGRRLFEAVDNFGRHHNVDFIELGVDSENSAVAFYNAIGFIQRQCTMIRWIEKS